MTETTGLEALEREAYKASWSDGIIDLYAGLSLVWMGVAWIWLEASAALAGVLPAVLVAPMLVLRRQFIEPRIGYARWRAPRRRLERRNLWAVLVAGMGMLTGGFVLLLYQSGGGADPALDLAPGILAWLSSLFAIGLALISGVWRILVYAAVLAVAGAAVVVAQANPGWALLAGGVSATIVGTALLIRFVQRYPRIEPS